MTDPIFLPGDRVLYVTGGYVFSARVIAEGFLPGDKTPRVAIDYRDARGQTIRDFPNKKQIGRDLTTV